MASMFSVLAPLKRGTAVSVTLLAAYSTANVARNKTQVYHPESHNLDKDGHLKYVKPIQCDDGHVIVPWEVPERGDLINKLKKESYDVVVIGGGATGAGCALDAATRGMKVALIERSDFGAGTSGRSTKLIHGGIRYLETAFMKLDYSAYKLVMEALEERKHMLTAAPYMNRPLPIMIPIYTWWEIPYMWVGAKVYDLVAGSDRSVPSSYYIDAEEAMYQYPNLKKDGLKGAVVYYDGQMNDTRMNLSVVLTAAQSGATVANYIQVTAILKDDKGNVAGVKVQDTQTGEAWEIKAKAIVNATGPFTDGIRHLDNPDAQNICVPAAGVHVVLPDHFSPNRMGLIVPKTTDGRVLFYLPWENGTLAGTTDSESDITMLPSPTKEEIQFILNESNRYLNATVTEDDIRSAWSGIRPLVKDPRHTNTAQISREHVLEVSDSKMVTIAGGKWTTYRRMAQDAIDKVQELFPDLSQKKCSTRFMQLVGADRIGEVCNQKFDRITITLREKYNMDKQIAEHLMKNYGTRALQIGELEKSGFLHRKPGDHPKRLHPKYPYLESEVVFAVQQEFAVKAVDVLARRTRLAYVDSTASEEVMDKVISMMAQLLKWDKKRCAAEKEEAQQFLATMHKK
ncbi:mitochondrial glycerol-3-phosphate dehydrogenase [Aphanomyces cochlioides]|nr:mitochondrial glycerol-3-phosphate dehydrogenase [Aphanomyces cochlioides]